ncbi:isochorismate synthase MenF [Lelliottia amnigena]|uniref:isochorismate synthase MenF n=1 Tax=Lelliottia amnigena TaxID=61646 RepID=UPI00103967C6|nr:isochorismate synthase MenF [Lelliottia amnigena]MBM7354011.1 menaquinone-specific isochorismate synthase [Lelliottia amnigena]TCD14760.1 isochorismate synthase MenF [Lelliottia amnigena]WSO20421.1 isochorismate synthase MenF [Lelliottia amnigena]
MHSISIALERLGDFLQQDIPATPGLRHFDVSFPLNDAFDPLAWLGAQIAYPQFYWQQRSGDEEMAALGVAESFSTLSAARQFLSDRHASPDTRICGLNAFTPGQSHLFLPRLLWLRTGGVATLRLTLSSEISLQDDARCALEFLQQLQAIRPITTLTSHIVRETHLPARPEWLSLVSQATDAIARGEFEKVVLARATDLQFDQRVTAIALMAASRRINHNCYHFCMRFDAQNAFMGSSPERLWRRRGKRLRTEALAGTVASHADDAQSHRLGEWLLNDDKNQRENMLVVEDICQRLQHHTHALEVLPAQIVRLRKVQHLRRCIWTELKTADDEQCLHLLQPTAAVAGLPRDPARAFILRKEPFEREWYAGSAGYLSPEQSEFCVTLRCARVSDTAVRLYAGAGIVSGSVPEEEWQEIENKAAGLRTLLLMD